MMYKYLLLLLSLISLDAAVANVIANEVVDDKQLVLPFVNKMSFKNKVIIVTGASSGIGAATAVMFSQAGANVVMVGRNETKLKNVAEKCNKPLVLKADVTKDAKKIIDDTVKKFGKIDVLVNNAGLAKFGSVSKGDFVEAYDETMAVNVRAVINLTVLATPHLIKSKGNIINVSSVAALMVPGIPELLPYSVSKAALDMFTKGLALELSTNGVRVNSVNPGPVVTDFLENTNFSATWDQMAQATALKRNSSPEEIGDMILYLASDKARGITGSIFVIDNGLLLKR